MRKPLAYALRSCGRPKVFAAQAARSAVITGRALTQSRQCSPCRDARHVIFNALQQRSSAYASVLGALIELAGEKAYPVKIVADEPLDAVWEEPIVFDGCSVKGQAQPDQVQPIHFVKKVSAMTGATP